MLITDLFERITLYHLQVTAPTAVRRADGRWDVTVPVVAKKFYAAGKGAERETPLAERIEVGLFTAEPGATRSTHRTWSCWSATPSAPAAWCCAS